MNNSYVTNNEAILNTKLHSSNTIFTNITKLSSIVDGNNEEKRIYEESKPTVYSFLNTMLNDNNLKSYISCGFVDKDLHKSIKILIENTIFSINETDDGSLDDKIKKLLNNIDVKTLTNLEVKVRINGLLISFLKEIDTNPIYSNVNRDAVYDLMKLNNM